MRRSSLRRRSESERIRCGPPAVPVRDADELPFKDLSIRSERSISRGGPGRAGRSLLGDEAEAHLQEGADHGGANEGAVALLPAGGNMGTESRPRAHAIHTERLGTVARDLSESPAGAPVLAFLGGHVALPGVGDARDRLACVGAELPGPRPGAVLVGFARVGRVHAHHEDDGGLGDGEEDERGSDDRNEAGAEDPALPDLELVDLSEGQDARADETDS